MKTVALINGKGGVGKTTVALTLAVALSQRHTVCVVDLDPQVSATKWRDRRQPDNPTVVASPTARLRQTLEAARAAGVDYAVIDTAGRNDTSGLDAARVADLVLVPTTTSIVAIEALAAVRHTLLLARGAAALVLLNQINPSSKHQANEARETIRQLYGLACAPVHLCRRAVYDEALTPGSTPQELDSTSKASAEVQRLAELVTGLLSGVRHGENDRYSATA